MSAVITPPQALLAISQGTSSPTGQLAVSNLVDAVARETVMRVEPGCVDVQMPDVLARRLGQARLRRGDAVVLLCGGSTDPRADAATDPLLVADRPAPPELVSVVLDQYAEVATTAVARPRRPLRAGTSASGTRTPTR